MNRTQFTFYESFFRAVSRIRTPADRALAYDAICAYALYQQEPDMSAMPDSASIVFEMIRPILDSARRKSESGKKGGTHKQTASKPEAREDGEQDKEQEQEQDQVQDKEQMLSPLPPSGGETSKGRTFAKPSLEEVAAYCAERGKGVDAAQWYDHYTANGWKVGRNPMRDWKAAVRTWEKDRENARSGTGFSTSNPFLEMLAEERGRNGES